MTQIVLEKPQTTAKHQSAQALALGLFGQKLTTIEAPRKPGQSPARTR